MTRWFEIALGVATIATSTAALILAFNQNRLTERALSVDLAAKKPNFRIESVITPPFEIGGAYNPEDLNLFIKGNSDFVASITINHISAYRLEYYEVGYGVKDVQIPVRGYFNYCTALPLGTVQDGRIGHCWGENNIGREQDLHVQMIEELNNGQVSPYYGLGVETFFEITYTDVLEETQTVWLSRSSSGYRTGTYAKDGWERLSNSDQPYIQWSDIAPAVVKDHVSAQL